MSISLFKKEKTKLKLKKKKKFSKRVETKYIPMLWRLATVINVKILFIKVNIV